jgi:integrase
VLPGLPAAPEGDVMAAWLYRDNKQLKKIGPQRASWYVGWMDPDGKRRCKSFGPGADGKRLAFRFKKKVEAELLTGTYEAVSRKTWAEFRKEYDATVLAGKSPGYRGEIELALKHFERIVKPVKPRAVTDKALATYVAARQTERGTRPKSLVSPATVNKELRHLRAVLKKAKRWGYLPTLPEFSEAFVREPERLPTYVTPEHFAALYQAADAAKFPRGLPYPAADWWRALFMTAFMTGWRIGALLALRREDVDLDAGTAVTLAEHNKGKRDQAIDLHPVVVDHLKAIRSFDARVFPWTHGRRMIFTEFARIQAAAKVKPQRKERYGFHDLRRGFATMNADRLTADALQALMQHRDYQTTQRYINIARQLKPAAHDLYVPPVGKAAP